MKNFLLLIGLLTLANGASAQMYEEAKKPKVKAQAAVDTSRKYLGTGFTLGFSAGIDRGLVSGDYTYRAYTGSSNSYYYPYSYSYYSKSFEMKNAFGYFFSLAPGLQGSKYGVEFPFSFTVHRYKVPELSGEKLKISELEVGVLNYIKFSEEQNQIVVGVTYGFLENLYFNLGFNRQISKKLSAGVRLHLSMFSMEDGMSSVSAERISGNQHDIYASMTTLQFLVKYDLVSLRKLKARKIKEKRDNYYDYSAPPPPRSRRVEDTEPARIIDYSEKSDAELKTLLKEASAGDDLDAMLAIQKEIDSRKTSSELEGLSVKELEAKLQKALDAENYKEADAVKKELQKRKAGGAAPAKPSGGLQGKTVPQLKKLLDEALAKEDYKTAKEIQEIIKEKEGK